MLEFPENNIDKMINTPGGLTQESYAILPVSFEKSIALSFLFSLFDLLQDGSGRYRIQGQVCYLQI